jgi:hypothetical protein
METVTTGADETTSVGTNALVGAAVTVLSATAVPLAPLLGGGVAGYLQAGEAGDGLRTVDVCRSCGYEQGARDRGTAPACPDREIPPRWIETAKRHDLLPETQGAREDSMAGVPGTSP